MTYLNSTAQNTGKDISDFSRSVEPSVILRPLLEDGALDTAIDALTVTLAPYVPAPLPVSLADDALQPARDVPLSFPAAQGATYTSRLRAMLPIFITQLYAMFSVDHVKRGAMSRIWDIRRMLTGLYKTELQNFNLWAVRALQANPIWQSRVREDLGGDAAMLRWEKRRERLSLPPTPPAQKISKPAMPAAAHTGHSAKKLTDRSGLFCLARVSRSIEPEHRVHDTGAYSISLRSVALAVQSHKAIPLTPDQLRPRPADCPTTKAVTYKRLAKTWSKMQSEHMEWSYILVMADLMITSRDLREELVPP